MPLKDNIISKPKDRPSKILPFSIFR